jgi:hypothetical protein
LKAAADLQQLDEPTREARLRALALDPMRGSEVFPLCRMLFEAKPDQVFRRPLLGGPAFVGDTLAHDVRWATSATSGGIYGDWPLEPITIYEGVPILIVRGYLLGGLPESPEQYLEYCLNVCRWNATTYSVVDASRLRETVEQFIAANPEMARDADWLREQAK